jgi:hydrogenase/urease accessory protein HupE
MICGSIALWAPIAQPPTLFFAVVLIALGGLVAAALRLPAWATSVNAIALGAVYGTVSGSTMATTDLGWVGLLGSAAAVFFIVALVSALVVSLRAAWMRIAVRVAGSWIAAIGLLLVGWSFRR